jgi:uncharacterized OsmC-like protein/alpha/beta superfamily hydrolase
MGFQRLTFENREGKQLAARLELPADEKPKAYAVFAHCFSCSKGLKAVVHISRALSMKGIAVLRFDFTGLGDSEGEFSDTTFSTNVMDLVAAADYLKRNYEAPGLLIGHSLGGAAILQSASHIPSCKALATIASPSDPSDVTRILGSTKQQVEAEGEAELTIAGRSFRIRKEFLDDLEHVKMKDTIRNLNRPLLVLHSPADQVVGIQNAIDIFESAGQPKSFVSLDRADHLLSDNRDSRYAGSVLAAWASNYLDLMEEPPQQKNLKDNRVLVRSGKTGFQTEIIANGHRLIADEPIPAGGADTGPSPYDFLVASLGSCTAMTIRMYADRKQWPLEQVVVRLKHEKIHAEDCRSCEAKEGKLDHITREIEPIGPLSKEQCERLVEIANRCPVHRTLTSEITVETGLKAS